MAATIYDEGREAFRSGRDTDVCPYNDELRRKAWLDGHADAKRELDLD